MLAQLREAWRINNRIHLTLIDRISDPGWHCTLSKRGGRSVARQFTHIHYLRVHHLCNRANGLADGLAMFDAQDEPDRPALIAALTDSAARMEMWIDLACNHDANVRVFKRGVAVQVAYFIAHESHHRGSILLTLKQCGHPVDARVRYAIWDWDHI